MVGLKNFIAQNGGVIASVVLVVMCMNFVLMGVQKALELIKDKTESTLDNKVYDVLSKVCGFFSKIIDWIGANRAH